MNRLEVPYKQFIEIIKNNTSLNDLTLKMLEFFKHNDRLIADYSTFLIKNNLLEKY